MSRFTKTLILVALTAASLLAQVTGRVTGSVVDQTGATIPNATVAIYLPDGTSPLLQTTTNSVGLFDFQGVRPGLFTLVVEAPGFMKYKQSELKVDPARQTDLPAIKLEVGATSQSVEVSSGVSVVDTATAEVSTTVSTSQITNLPVIGRQVLNLLNTQAGVVQNNRQSTVINGMRPSYSNVVFDGVNIQDSVRTNDLDILSNKLTIAQVAEITVSTTNSNPTIGGAASTIVLVSPSGTNQNHGSLYYFNRNAYFTANDWFSNKNGVARPPRNMTQIGGHYSGAIIKDKLFYFGVYEAYRDHRQLSKTLTIPTPTARQGIVQYLVGGAVQQFDTLKPFGLAPSKFMTNLLSQVPAVGNNTGIGDGLNTTGYTYNARSNTTRDNITGKLDYNMSTRHVFAGSYNWQRDVPDRNDGTYYTLVPPTFNDNRNKLVTASWRWTPTATLTMEARGGFSFTNVPFVLRDKPADKYISTTNLYFSTPAQISELGEGRNLKQWNFQDNVNWVKNKHSVSFGFQTSLFRSESWNYNSPATVFPVYTIGTGTSKYGFNLGDIPGANSTYTTTANQILAATAGLISTAQQGFNITSPSSGFVPGSPQLQHQRFDQFALYAMDNYKLTRQLTLTVGLRWDYMAPVDSTDGLAAVPRLIDNNPITTLMGNATIDFGGSTAGRPFYKRDLNNFAPNIALAWDPFGDGKTSLRAGYNIAYVNDNLTNSVYNSVFGVNNGLSSSRTINNLDANIDAAPGVATPTFLFPTTTLDQFNLSKSSPPAEGLANPNLVMPYVQQWTLSVQRDVKGWVLEGRYVGNHAIKMLRGIDFNQVNINQSGLLDDFKRARNNGFLSQNAGKGFVPTYNAGIAGSQPLPYLSTLPALALTNSTLLTNIRQGEVGTYAQNIQSLYPYPTLGYSFFPNPYALYTQLLSNLSTSNYHAMQLEVRKSTRGGMQFQANYSFSKALTDSNAFRGIDAQVDNANPRAERARADYDLTHAFKFNHMIPLPFGKGHRLGTNSTVVNHIIDNWSLAGFGLIQTGSPVSVLSARGTLNRGARSANNTVDTNANISQLHEATGLFMTGNGPYWIDPSHIGSDTRGVAADGSAPFTGQLFFNPQPGTQGSFQKRSLDGPGFWNYNLSIVKRVSFKERYSVELHADMFNVFNHTNFYLSDQNINSTGFGRITSQNYSNDGVGPRVLQFGLYTRF